MPKPDYIEHRLRKYTVTTVEWPAQTHPPDFDEIHYTDGRVALLSDLISAVEATIEPRGILVGGIWIPDRGAAT